MNASRSLYYSTIVTVGLYRVLSARSVGFNLEIFDPYRYVLPKCAIINLISVLLLLLLIPIPYSNTRPFSSRRAPLFNFHRPSGETQPVRSNRVCRPPFPLPFSPSPQKGNSSPNAVA